MVGSAIVRQLKQSGYSNLLFRGSKELDLRRQNAVEDFFESERPDYVFLAAARVGGIHANNAYAGEFIYDNLMMEANIIHSAHQSGVQKLLFLGSSCIYPKFADQPLKEESLLTGPLEPTNEAYAIAKIAGIKLCQFYRQQYNSNFIAAMPTNLYGFGDNYHLQNAHVLPALLRKFHEAKINQVPGVTVWGTGSPLREFMFADDLAKGCLFLMDHYDASTPINIGTGEELSIKALASLIAEVVGYTGEILFDTSRPDGTPRKLMDSSRLVALGYQPDIKLQEGLKITYDDFKAHYQRYTAAH